MGFYSCFTQLLDYSVTHPIGLSIQELPKYFLLLYKVVSKTMLHNFHPIIQIVFYSVKYVFSTYHQIKSHPIRLLEPVSLVIQPITEFSTDSSLLWNFLKWHLRSHEMKLRIQRSPSCLLSLPRVLYIIDHWNPHNISHIQAFTCSHDPCYHVLHHVFISQTVSHLKTICVFIRYCPSRLIRPSSLGSQCT